VSTVDYPSIGVTPNDILDIPAQALNASQGIRVRVGEVPMYSVITFISEDSATGALCTVWVDLALVQVTLRPAATRWAVRDVADVPMGVFGAIRSYGSGLPVGKGRHRLFCESITLRESCGRIFCGR
jgi:hypothetical protein